MRRILSEFSPDLLVRKIVANTSTVSLQLEHSKELDGKIKKPGLLRRGLNSVEPMGIEPTTS